MGDLVTSWVELDRLVGGCCLRGGTDRCSLFSLGKTSRLVQAARNLARAAVTLMITGGAAPDRPTSSMPVTNPSPPLLFDLQRLRNSTPKELCVQEERGGGGAPRKRRLWEEKGTGGESTGDCRSKKC